MSEKSVKLGRVTVSQAGESEPEIISILLCKAQETGLPIVITIKVEPAILDMVGSVDIFGAMGPGRLRVSPKVICED
jgi:hypothetical protein